MASCIVPEGTPASHRFPRTYIQGVSIDMLQPPNLILNPPTAPKSLPKILELSSSSVGMSFRDTDGNYETTYPFTSN